MFGNFFNRGVARPDITVDGKSFDVRQREAERERVFVSVQSNPIVRSILDSTRRVYFEMEGLMEYQPKGSLVRKIMSAAMNRYIQFAESLNSNTLTVESAEADALALAKGMNAAIVYVKFLLNSSNPDELRQQLRNDEVSIDEYIDNGVDSEFDDTRYGNNQAALMRGQQQWQRLKRRSSRSGL